jgi:hypothetical protein
MAEAVLSEVVEKLVAQAFEVDTLEVADVVQPPYKESTKQALSMGNSDKQQHLYLPLSS